MDFKLRFNKVVVRAVVASATLGIYLITAGLTTNTLSVFLCGTGYGFLDGALLLAATYPVYVALGNQAPDMWKIYLAILFVTVVASLSSMSCEFALHQKLDSQVVAREFGRAASLSLIVFLLRPRPQNKRRRKRHLSSQLTKLLAKVRMRLQPVPT